MNSYDLLILKLDGFIRKYYKNKLLKGAIYSFLLLSTFLLTIILIEYFGKLNSTGRFILFFGFLLTTSVITIKFLLIPFSKLYRLGNVISYEKAALIIGEHFPNIQDKILNTLQLELQKKKMGTNEVELIDASIQQKMLKLNPLPFNLAVNFKENLRYLKGIIAIVFIFILISFIDSNIIFSSVNKLINYSKIEYAPPPFHYQVNSENLEVLEKENFTLDIVLSGKEIPARIYIVYGDNNHYVKKKSTTRFEFVFRNVQKPISFYLTDGKQHSQVYELSTIPKPTLQKFDVVLNYPSYVKKDVDTVENIGNLEVPEGTKVSWFFKTKNVDTLTLAFNDTSYISSSDNFGVFNISRKVLNSSDYSFYSKNRFSDFTDTNQYYLAAIKDQHPLIDVEQSVDSSNSLLRYFSGQIEDDYGFTKLNFVYKLNSWGEPKKIPLSVSKLFSSSNFYHFFDLSSLGLDPGDVVDYYFEVWDNDEINGPKSNKTQLQIYKAPTESELNKISKENSNSFKKELNNSIAEARELKLELQKIKNDLLNKKSTDWEDKNRLENFLKKQQTFENKISQLVNQNKSNSKELDQFNEKSKELVEKTELLNKLFDELMNEEMKKLYEELQKLLNEMDKDKLLDKMEDMELNQEDLLKELDRSLEQYKQLEFEQNFEKITESLKKLAEEQKSLSEKTKEKSENNFQLNKKEEQLKEKFNSIQKELDDLEEINNELEYKNDLPEMNSEEEQVNEDMKKSMDELENNNNKKSSQSQKNAAEKMKEMASKMEASQMEMQSKSMELDMKALRQLLENLVQFSFDQESIINNLKSLSTRDPKYVKLGQHQQKLQEDVKVIEDSLFALSKRVPFLGPHVNQEVLSIKNHLDQSLKNITERKTAMANANQQYVMTSINNLALILDDVQKQMQNSMPGTGQCNKPGGSGKKPSPDMKKMREKMKSQLEEMKKLINKGDKPGGKKPGESNSPGTNESLARLAAQQAALKKQIRELSQSLNEDGSSMGNGLKEIIKELEKLENDVINNNINIETINRQKNIMVKMLEHEKAMREQEKDNKRESNEIKEQEYSNPNQFLEYKRKKEKEVELLKTIPPSLRPYYKNKVNDYFNIIQ